MNRHHGSCIACGQTFTDHGWIERHSVIDHDADQHHLDAGDYHDDCCPLCSTPNESAA